eukprot:TRINITY_DN90503_c0_g1_i1.p1 TRINITY_DN90503_c0_g1~~TRINITY_DN90503_c0_g1_i1.p1  ORF type:complete len:596 (+),score=144.92 TRINITY_DN90503_c0_g1_i1:103-1890(+)
MKTLAQEISTMGQAMSQAVATKGPMGRRCRSVTALCDARRQGLERRCSPSKKDVCASPVCGPPAAALLMPLGATAASERANRPKTPFFPNRQAGVSHAPKPAGGKGSLCNTCQAAGGFSPTMYSVGSGAAQAKATSSRRRSTSLAAPAVELSTERQTLIEGSFVRLQNGDDMVVTRPLGRGSFGTVWAARRRDKSSKEQEEDVAIKEVKCKSERAVKEVVREAEVLKALSKCPRVPALLSFQVGSKDGRGASLVRMAMRRVHGEQVDQYLKNRRNLPANGRIGQLRQFAEAVALSREMVSQLAPVFHEINKKVIHRDATSRNILIDHRSSPQFAVVDFGLSVSASGWRKDWEFCEVSGDGRYWPTSSWFLFSTCSPEKLKREVDLYIEYQRRLDFHSVGIAALQLFCEACPMQEVAVSNSRVIVYFKALQKAWKSYWQEVTRLWGDIFEVLRQNGSLRRLKETYMRMDVARSVQRKIKALRKALSDVAEACEQTDATEDVHFLTGAKSLCDALRTLLSPGEGMEVDITWLDVQAAVSGSSLSRKGPWRQGIPALPKTASLGSLSTGVSGSSNPPSTSVSALASPGSGLLSSMPAV